MFGIGGISSTEDKEMPDILRAKVLLSLSRPVGIFVNMRLKSENQAVLLIPYVFAEQAQPPHPRRDLATLRIELEPS